MTNDLPVRPRVVAGLPVLRRRAGELQIGLDPRHASVVGGLSDPVVSAVRRLTGHRTAAEVLADLEPADRDTLCALMHALLDRGLLEDAAAGATPVPGRLAGEATATARHGGRGVLRHPSARRELAVAVHGDGRLAVAVACLLASSGVGHVHVAATGAVLPEDTGTGYLADDVGRQRRVAARRAVQRVDPSVRTAPFGPDLDPDLVILTDALVHPPERVDRLTSAGVPHLTVRARDGTGVVGPLVVPGLTSCLHCADLQRCDRDECWPHLAAQLVGRTQLADLAGTQATAALAVAQALDAVAWLRGGTNLPTTCGTSVELDLRSATVRHRAWPAHAACPCGAAGRTAPKLLRIPPNS